jgi:general secretion pathway protein J
MRTKSASKRRNNPRAGFTLIETLAALAIAAAVFAVVAEFAGRTLRNWNYGHGTIATIEMVTRGLGRLGTDLSLALPMTPPGADGSSVYFAGDAEKMVFVAATGFGVGDRGLELISIASSSENGEFFLVRQRSVVASPPQQFRDPVVLLRGRMQVQFAYIDATGKSSASWINRPEMPAAIAVVVNVPQAGPLFPRPLLFPVPVNFGVDCIPGMEDEGARAPRCQSGDKDKDKAQQAQPGVQPPVPGTRGSRT